jgi:hypothetical protein
MPTSVQVLIEGGIARFRADYKINAPVTIDNPLKDLQIETNFEIFEEVVAKVLINAWESYDNKPGDPRPIAIQVALVDHSDEEKPSSSGSLIMAAESTRKSGTRCSSRL